MSVIISGSVLSCFKVTSRHTVGHIFPSVMKEFPCSSFSFLFYLGTAGVSSGSRVTPGSSNSGKAPGWEEALLGKGSSMRCLPGWPYHVFSDASNLCPHCCSLSLFCRGHNFYRRKWKNRSWNNHRWALLRNEVYFVIISHVSIEIWQKFLNFLYLAY